MNRNKFISSGYNNSNDGQEVDLYQQMMLEDLENGNDLYTEKPLTDSEMKKLIEGTGNVGGVDSDEDFEYDYQDDYGIETDEETGIQMKPIKKMNTQQPTQPKTFPENSETEYNNQLSVGQLVELEHLHWWSDEDPDLDYDILGTIAENIATDHLKVTPDYYTRLIKAGLVDEQDAIDLYTSIYGAIEPVITTQKKTFLPLPKKKLPTQNITSYDDDEDLKIVMDVMSQDDNDDDLVADITVEPKVRTSQIMTDTPRKKIVLDDIDDYGDLSESVDSGFDAEYGVKLGSGSGNSYSNGSTGDSELDQLLSGGDFDVDGE